MANDSFNGPDPDWRKRTMLAGGVIGSLVGVIAAYMYVRAADEATENGEVRELDTMTVFSLGRMLLGVIRQIADMGARR